MLRFLPYAAVGVLWLFCLVDVITSREDSVRNLAKTWWLLIVLFFPLAGSIVWLVAGRPQPERPMTRGQGAAPGFPEYERRGRFASADPERDEDFLRKVRERAEEQRARYEAERREEQRRREQGEDPVP
ncbi:PLDc_N domain-containing protein [Nocardioides sp. W3-2-3]|uniref:PLD nuclease N-terminal domain-containing protein n=1 Tax=Nocardioides convexus TaxID=2712224 RepID=UPI002418A6A3|nr:PLD nuclease N-terminal domain-containing protein [Nocardioides convexus]NHA00924.1 PLDc_N domain-containing protein [Nocardioides convexus]